MRPGYTDNPDPHPLAKLRRERGITLRDLETLTRAGGAPGVSFVAISHIENGHSVPRAATKRTIAKALDVAVTDIWPEPDPQFQPHPDDDPDVPDLHGLGLGRKLRAGETVIYLNHPLVHYVDGRGRFLASEKPEGLVIHVRDAVRVDIRHRLTPPGGRPRGRRTRKAASASSGASDDGPGEPAPHRGQR